MTGEPFVDKCHRLGSGALSPAKRAGFARRLAALLVLCCALAWPVSTPATPEDRGRSTSVRAIGGSVSEASFESDKDKVRLPTRRGSKRLFTDAVAVNGERVGYFMIDTGANITVIDPSFVAALGLEPYGTIKLDDGSKQYQTFVADSLTLGPLTIRNQLVGGVDLPEHFQEFAEPVVGIIGHDVLGRVPFTIDYTIPEIVLHDPGAFERPEEGRARELTALGPIQGFGPFDAIPSFVAPAVRGELNGEEVLCILGTGFNGTLSAGPLLAERYPDMVGQRVIKDHAYGSIGRDPPEQQRRLRVDSFRLFGREWSGIPDGRVGQFRYSMTREGPLDEVSVRIGGRILEHFRLTFSLDHQKVWAQPVPSFEQRLRNGEIELGTRGFAGGTPLANAVYYGEPERFKLLLEAGASVDYEDRHGRTLLHYAVKGGRPAILKALLEHNPDPPVDQPQAKGMTPLALAANKGDAEMARLLLDAGADPNIADQDGVTPLHYAAKSGDPATTEALLAHNARLDARNESGVTPLLIAATYGRKEVFQTLLKAGADPTIIGQPNGDTLLHAAAYGGEPGIVESALKADLPFSVDALTEGGVTALMVAAEKGHEAAVELLLEAGADPLAENPHDNQQCAMGYAILYGQSGVVELFLEHGTDVDIELEQARTPLMLAAAKGSLRVIVLLLKHSADVKASDSAEMTPLHYAAKYKKPQAARLLLDAGANVDATGRLGLRPLHFAAMKGDLNTARVLLRAGANPRRGQGPVRSPLALARENGHSRMVQLLEGQLDSGESSKGGRHGAEPARK